MLLGAVAGLYHNDIKANSLWDVIKLMGCILAWYVFMILIKKSPVMSDIQYVSLLPLAGICYYFYKVCTYRFWGSLYSHKIWGQIIYIVGGVCLEAYLIQWYIFTDIINYLFPLNIPIIILMVLIVAYIIKVLANFYMQTYQEKDYRWNDILLYKKEA